MNLSCKQNNLLEKFLNKSKKGDTCEDFNVFHVDVPYLYPLETSENIWSTSMCYAVTY